MSVTIVITTFNRAGVLRDLLLRLETEEDDDFEVVVAMDGCTDGTEAMLAGLRTRYPLRWVNTGFSGYGLALARNRGILAARADVVAIVDDDSVPVPGFVRAHRAASRPRCITGGPRDPHDPDRDPRLAGKMAALRALPALTPMTVERIERDHPDAYLVENNVSMRRADWIALGLFTERLRIYGVIGQEFFARVRHAGWHYQFAPDAGVVHREEIEGDNGLDRARKTRQFRLAGLLRPGLMTPRQYAAQQAWAEARDRGECPPAFPPWWPHAAGTLGRRALRRATRGFGRGG
ncbi:glycosyltransferase family 2 protein [Roseobacter sp. HKCCA0434]|uniref:glycosyltransferase family 2 protein n=1 Tax=Roseobacter sp. HKCCA0434 TaxID=3079297 RepID=UPI002905E40E|nr:glycosyltransferase [Roseobacter sp. HKCCA0434]